MPFQDLVVVYIALDVIEATVVTGLLESAGIEPWVRDMTVRPYPVSVGPMGEKRVAVPRTDAERARDLLRRAVEDGVLPREDRIR